MITLGARSRARLAARATAAATIAAGLALAGCGTASSSQPGGSGTQSGSTAPASPTSPASTATPTGSQGAAPGFQVLSMTFVSDSQGFALGTQACGSRRCLALLGTTDGGGQWHPLTAPTRQAGGVYSTCPHSGPCVQQVRFATPLIGYAFEPSLFLTTDGGLHWHRLPGINVSSLEAADGTVVRVVSGNTGCAGQPYQVQSAADGASTWTDLAPPRIEMICPPVLYRQGTSIVLAGYGNPAGGVRATAQIDRSADGGQTWSSGPDSCGGTDGYASSVALAPPDVLVLLCQHQMPGRNNVFGPAWVRVSTDDGATFGPDQVLPAPPRSGGYYRYQLAAASAAGLIVAETGQHGSQLLTTQTGGRTWTTTLVMPSTAPVLLVGFEDPHTARVAQADTVWTTTNGARTWQGDQFVTG